MLLIKRTYSHELYIYENALDMFVLLQRNQSAHH